MFELYSFLPSSFYNWTSLAPSKAEIKETVDELIPWHPLPRQKNILQSRVFTQLLAFSCFAISFPIFFSQVLPLIAKQNVTTKLPNGTKHFARVYLPTSYPLLATIAMVSSSIFFIYSLIKDYWQDPYYVDEQRTLFLANKEPFYTLFSNVKWFKQLILNKVITPQELRLKLEDTLPQANHLDWIRWTLNLSEEDLLFFKQKNIIDTSLYTQFSIQNTPLCYLEIFHKLPISIWINFLSKLLQTGLLTSKDLETKINTEVNEFASLKEVLGKVPWKIIKYLLSQDWVSLELLKEKSSDTDGITIKLLLQEDDIEGLLEAKLFTPEQMAFLTIAEIEKSQDFSQIFTRIPLSALIELIEHRILSPKILHKKLATSSFSVLRYLSRQLSLQDLDLMFQKEILQPDLCKTFLLKDCEELGSLKAILTHYPLDSIFLFLEKEILDLELIQNLSGSEPIGFQQAQSIIAVKDTRSLSLLDKLVCYKFLTRSQVKSYVTFYLSKTIPSTKAFNLLSLDYMKMLIKKDLVDPKLILAPLEQQLEETGLFEFFEIFNWSIADFHQLLGEQAAQLILNKALQTSCSRFTHFFQFLDRWGWGQIKLVIQDFGLSPLPLQQLLKNTLSTLSLKNFLALTSTYQLEELKEYHLISQDALNEACQTSLGKWTFFQFLHLFSEAEIRFLLHSQYMSPANLIEKFYQELNPLLFKDIEQILLGDFFLLSFVKQKINLYEEVGLSADMNVIRELTASLLSQEEKQIKWEEWKKNTLSVFNQKNSTISS